MLSPPHGTPYHMRHELLPPYQSFGGESLLFVFQQAFSDLYWLHNAFYVSLASLIFFNVALKKNMCCKPSWVQQEKGKIEIF